MMTSALLFSTSKMFQSNFIKGLHNCPKLVWTLLLVLPEQSETLWLANLQLINLEFI